MNKTKILNIVKQEIEKWDPVDLLKIGAPKDEYNEEIYMISNKIEYNSTIDDIAIIIYDVLIEMFDECTFNDIDELKYKCNNVAKIIYLRLSLNN